MSSAVFALGHCNHAASGSSSLRSRLIQPQYQAANRMGDSESLLVRVPSLLPLEDITAKNGARDNLSALLRSPDRAELPLAPFPWRNRPCSRAGSSTPRRAAADPLRTRPSALRRDAARRGRPRGSGRPFSPRSGRTIVYRAGCPSPRQRSTLTARPGEAAISFASSMASTWLPARRPGTVNVRPINYS